MSNIKNQKHIELYIEESKELLETLETSLYKLEKNNNDTDLINDIFRIAHTFKGNSAALKLNNISNLTHKIEDVMGEIREEKLVYSDEIHSILFESLDLLYDLIEQFQKTGKDEIDISSQINELENMLNINKQDTVVYSNKKLELSEKQINEINNYNYNIFYFTLTMKSDNPLKSISSILIVNQLKPLSDDMFISPKLEDIEQEKFFDKIFILILTRESKEKIINVLEKNVFRKITYENFKRIDKNELSDLFLKKQRVVRTKSISLSDTIRVKAKILDELLVNIGEMTIDLSIFNNELKKTDNIDLLEKFSEIDKTNAIIQKTIMNLRLLPLSVIFNKYPRLIKETAAKLNKKIKFNFSGEETLLDKNTIDELNNFLIHLLRNSLDHGIELPEIRKQNNKDEQGSIELNAYYEGNFIIIEIKDDGKGIDGNKIANIAIKKDLITEAEVQEMSLDEKVNLIFLPGFSSVEEVSSLSGRGVGMDVVKAGVENLRGRINILTKPLKGSIIKIQLPLTIAIVPALICQFQNHFFTIPVEEIWFTSKIKSKDIIKKNKNYYTNINNNMIQVIYINDLLKYNYFNIHKTKNEELDIIIYESFDKKFGIIVDEIVDQYDIVIKNVSKYLMNITGFTGTTILKTGLAVPFLDLAIMAKGRIL